MVSGGEVQRFSCSVIWDLSGILIASIIIDSLGGLADERLADADLNA